MFGPHVTITTAGHPVLPELRALGAQFNLAVTIGSNAWIGSGATVMPGVSIGENSVIGAGSVVSRGVPANVVAFGAPCRVVRQVGEHDAEFYWRDRRIDIDADQFLAARSGR
ncbi:DapH/DapD/GlmU-related protein [Miniimonas arenae]|uniref:DapH/DapD/GlmU-related protein n=1 Tax=Miniimonas arenae TaxID=676201 RepID=UPI0028A8BC67|nr:DapH/DapD/GlmU-related protein [Miniimonas arenae]